MAALAFGSPVAHDPGVLSDGDNQHSCLSRQRAVRRTPISGGGVGCLPKFANCRRAASIVALAALALASAACGGGSPNDSSAVEDLLNKQLALTKAGDWQGLYNTYSPRYQNRCPYDALLKRAAGYDAASLESLSYDQLRVQIDGDKAYVTYVTTRSGKVVAAVTDASPDIYVKIDGAWLDEYDELTVCS